ncbi:MAG TPA: hypothetical protein VLK53_13020 [Gaiellaceae bacterium]|nr:hypothetical protein [Gaiellaceae bacterium]
MSEPHSDDVADALARLEEQVTQLHEDVRRLDPGAPLPVVDDHALQPAPGSYAWVGALDSPVRRRPQVPRLVLEGLFLAAAAAAAAIADLDPVAIGGVMVGAWVLVALIEWAASRADRRQELPMYVAAPSVPVAADPAWFSPPVEHTLLEGADGDGDTAVTRLPPRLDDAEATVEQRL